MTIISETHGRQAVHRRTMQFDVYACPDGMWEIDAEIADVPQRPIELICGPKVAGEDLHRMKLRLRVDAAAVIREAGASTLTGPYGALCADHGDVYRRLIGLNVLKGFRQAVKERLGGVAGCTHITELAQSVPTALIQGIAQETAKRRAKDADAETQQPFQLDRCHALRLDGEAARIYYPRWYQPTAKLSDVPRD